MLRLPRFRMEIPRSADEAARVLRELGAGTQDPGVSGMPGMKVLMVAGGTDVYPNMKRRQLAPEVLVSLRRALSRDVRADGPASGATIGAGATLSSVSAHPVVRSRYAALAMAAGLVSTPQLRNMGTIGGNVCLDTRCNWYDESGFWRTAEGFCMKTHPSVVCRVATSSPRCLAVASADTVPALLALGATVTVRSAQGERTVDLGELYREDGIRYLTIRRDEIVTEVALPPAEGWRSTYLKLRDRGSFDFPIVGLAAAVRMDGARVADARVALTAVASRPILVDAAAKALRGSRLDGAAIEAAAEAAFKAARPMDNTSGTIAQRKRTVSVFATRALRELRDN
ncbi:MAG: FAD binding domain-containing protein [Chloroflexota bacterium]|nr:FAD binding domain-containing protein [Chloroflexota bacterium]